MANLLAHSDPSELVDFMSFIGLLVHRLKVSNSELGEIILTHAFQDSMFQVLDELITPLTSHVSQLLAQPASGTDDALTHGESKKGYLTLLSTIMSAKLQGVFLSERTLIFPPCLKQVPNPLFPVGNKGQLEGLLEMMERLVVDLTDPVGQRSALQFLARCVNVWAVQSPDGAPQALPGFERFVYERLIPATFRVLSLPEFNTKDGQVMLVRIPSLPRAVILSF